jgi:Ulp1 family protease
MDKIFIPINEDNVHWILVVVDVKNRVIQHYDSLHKQKKKKRKSKEDPIEFYTMEESYDLAADWNDERKEKLENVLRYLNDKHLTTHGINLTSDWKTECVMAPVQPNCKIVMIKL